PEAQLDRFLFKVLIGYPDRDEERAMVRLHGQAAMPTPEGGGVAPLCDLGFLTA
ncbi:MAG TPA: magnesium chelatase, partial [Acidobacteria bacterium]|nr:magnesium chelatase [Acidobacteriota bacterium]